jgi:hypothetical protein
MSNEPNVNFGSPTIFLDSHPAEQESYLYSYWSSLKSSLKIAFTGEVPPFLNPGTLRLTWWMRDGTQGIKDYDLHEYAQVRDNFDVLLNMPEIRRVLITGYAGQNPYILVNGTNPWQDKFRRMDKEAKRAKVFQETAERKGTRNQKVGVYDKAGPFDNDRAGRTGVLVDIEAVIEQNDKAEEERRRIDSDKIWKENEGLLSGEMV